MTGMNAFNLLLDGYSGPFTLIDVGARWGAHPRWAPLADRATIIGFEPDAAECERLNAGSPPHISYVPIGLADEEGERDLFITREPACSSNYAPIKQLYQHYAGLECTTLERVVRMNCRRLDDVLRERHVSEVAAMKLDTQGSELSILKGSVESLKTCSLIDVEVEFNPIYAGQDLFCDLDRWLRDQGFVLWRLENLSHYASEEIAVARTDFVVWAPPAQSAAAPVSNGQVFWSQAQYVRADYTQTGVSRMSFDDAIRPAILCGLYGFWDLAIELIRKTGDENLLQNLRGACGLSTMTSTTAGDAGLELA